ncbi:MAG: hypothetical protein A3F18_05795 [Legionellales bacterium RIFCSPHIGHO2_12_FULL_37_14]|nr:MAG: hypothetical protein A3F18_05795 [Legionellales bacterium RIFCSPHIGHO2_12_FULL_37_14]
MAKDNPSFWQRFTRLIIKFSSWLDEKRYVYVLFALASISDARNIISYVFEAMNDGSTLPSDKMHFWLLSPIGIAVASIETIFLLAFAALGGYFKESEKNRVLRWLAISWPYARDSIKALKNGYKGARSLLFIGITFGASALIMSSVLMPLGVTLGAAYLTSRVWYRHMCSWRKKKQAANDNLQLWLTSNSTEKKAKELSKNPILQQQLEALIDKGEIKNLNDAVPLKTLLQFVYKKQPPKTRITGYISAAFNSTLDGMYLYAGLYLLCNLIPPLAIMVNVFAIFYVSLSLVRGIYEEFCFQRKLELSGYLAEKRLLLSCPDKTKEVTDRLKEIEKETARLTNLTYGHAVGEAIRDGLGIYCGITTILIFVSLFTPIPLPVLLTFIVLGVVGLIATLSYNTYRVNQFKKGDLNEQEAKALRDNKTPDATEVLLRAFPAGGRQSLKITNYLFNAFQEENEAGHYQASREMALGSAILAPLFGVIYVLKSLAKGFGRDKEELNLPSASSNDYIDSSRDPSPLVKDASSTSLIQQRLNPTSLSEETPPSMPPSNTSRRLIANECRLATTPCITPQPPFI